MTDLIYDEFKEYEIPYNYSGFEMFGDSYNHRFMFDNGYGASVIKHYGSYGYEMDLFELAVINKDGSLCYDTEITDDVEGYLSNDDALCLLKRIKELKKK